MKQANGEYIVFVDSDDFLSPVALEKMHTNMSENDTDFMFSYAYQIQPSEFKLWELPNNKDFTAHIKTPGFLRKRFRSRILSKNAFQCVGKNV